MSQTRNHEYKATLLSDRENKRHLGQYFPGVYCGFDTLTTPGGADFDIVHTSTGVITTKQDNTLNNASGVVCTKHGVIIIEDAAITGFTLGTNVGNPADRYDLIYLEHNYVLLQGGQAATYGIQQGPNNNPTIPALTSPNNRILIGVIKLVAGASASQALTDIITPPALDPRGTYTRERPNDLGGLYSAKLSLANKFTKQLAGAVAVALKYSVVSGDDIRLEQGTESNLYEHTTSGANPAVNVRYIKLPELGEGTLIKIQNQLVGEYLNFYHDYTGAAPTGYAKVLVPYQYQNYPAFGPNGSLGITNLDIVTLQYINGYWVVMDVAFNNSTTFGAYQTELNLTPTPNTAYFVGTDTAISIGTDIALTTISLPANVPVSLVSGEINILTAGTYKVEQFWQVDNRSALKRICFTTNSSNDPAWGYQGDSLATEEDYTTGTSVVQVETASVQISTVRAISSGVKIKGYVEPQSCTINNLRLVMAITKLD